LGAGVALIGLVVPAIRYWYDYSWFVGFAVSFVSYLLLMSGSRVSVHDAALEAPARN